MESKLKKGMSQLCRRFGTLAVKNGYITEEKLKAAIIEQVEEDLKGGEHRLIGTILYEKGWLTWEQVDSVLKELFRDKEKQQR
jgi:hypothetical protein